MGFVKVLLIFFFFFENFQRYSHLGIKTVSCDSLMQLLKYSIIFSGLNVICFGA